MFLKEILSPKPWLGEIRLRALGLLFTKRYHRLILPSSPSSGSGKIVFIGAFLLKSCSRFTSCNEEENTWLADSDLPKLYGTLAHIDTPLKVSIAEAIEIAKIFSTKDSGRFVNGILDAIYQDIIKNKMVTS